MPSMDGGGVEKNLIIIANYFANRFPKVSLITYDNKFKKYFNKKIKFIYVRNNSSKNQKKYYKYFICLLLLIKEYLKNKKILVFSFQANVYVIMLSFFFNYKVITRSNSSPVGWEGNIFKKNLFKFFFRYAENIIVNSKKFKKEFKDKFNINTLLIYNPLNKSQILSQSKKYLKFKFFDDPKSLKIINIARFTEQKDHMTLLKSFNIVKKKIRCKLLIMGYGTNKVHIKKFIIKYKLSKYVKIINFQNNPYNYLNMADVFILTSKFEGLPNVLLEAQTLKKYVISSNCPTGPKEILKNGKCGDLFPVGDYEKLAELIINYKAKPNKYRSKINLAYNSLSRFDYAINCKRYYKIIYKYL